MKVSLSWLKEYASITSSPAEIAERLTMAGMEVEAVADRYEALANVVVAKVLSVEKHPEADRLTCCSVDVGSGIVSIVCGAPNVRQGLVVPCALPGAVLPGDLTIKKNKLRGVVSEGMLCSAAELRLATDASGLMELDAGLAPGTPIVNALGLVDSVFEIDLTPNRPDCLSAVGIAREVAAFQDPPTVLDVSRVDGDFRTTPDCSIHDVARVDILDPDLCPRYAAGFLFNVSVGPSPFWLRNRLESVGMTPVNNVVDVTNFVMLETGQPLHAFDFDVLAQGRIEVRRAGQEIKFTTLDSKEHVLEPDMLMICDGERPVGIAGVMGGENSEITGSTTRVLVESAYFNPVSIRKTAKRSGINTDASHRFERGVDPDGILTALKRAVALIADVSGASVADGLIDERPVVFEPVSIELDTDFLNRRLGTDLSADTIKNVLESVDFAVTPDCGDPQQLMVTVPSFRVDVSRPEDLSEEVARLWGYNRIKTSFPAIPALRKKMAPAILLRQNVRGIMNGFGFSEAVNYSFTSPKSCDRLDLIESDPRRSVEMILNPISEDMAALRSSLLPGLLETMKRNNSKQVDTLRLFEVGKMFLATEPGIQPVEKEVLAGLWTGDRSSVSWHAKKTACDFFDIKGIVQGLFDSLKIEGVSYSRVNRNEHPYYKPGFGAVVEKDNRVLGSLGQINPSVLKNFGLKQDAVVFEIDMAVLLGSLPGDTMSVPQPKYPSLSRDITIIVDRGIEAGAVVKAVDVFRDTEELVEDIFLFDVYEGEPLAKGKKSLSLRIVYRSWEKTLKEKAVKKIHDSISMSLLKQFNAGLPS